MGLISPWLTYRNSQGIILVDDRDHSHVEELRESILSVHILRSLHRILDPIHGNDDSCWNLHLQYRSSSIESVPQGGEDAKIIRPRDS